MCWADWLSQYKRAEDVKGTRILVRYVSAIDEKRDTVICFLDFHENLNKNLDKIGNLEI